MIVASLKGKMGDLALPTAVDAAAEPVDLPQAQRDAIEILVAWGDSRADAMRWLQRAGQLHPETETSDEWVRIAYRIKSGMEG